MCLYESLTCSNGSPRGSEEGKVNRGVKEKKVSERIN